MATAPSDTTLSAGGRLAAAVARTVGFCVDHAIYVVVIAGIISAASAVYAARHFAINTDVNQLISTDLPWRQRELKVDAAFPTRRDNILAVVDAPTPELATAATKALMERLQGHSDLFHEIREQGGGPFFQRNGFLFVPTDQLEQMAQSLTAAAPLIGTLAQDPSLRGLQQGLDLLLAGVQRGRLTLDQMAPPLTHVADTVEDVLAGHPGAFSWEALMKGAPATPADLRKLIELRPVLDYGALEPGKAATDTIRKAAADADLAGKFQARVRLTGQVPIADEEFATVREGAFVNGFATVVVVLVILWLALRSKRIIVAVFLSLVVGLSVTAALGLMMVGALNMISVAFAVLFVGLGVDFGIQYAVRYRAERYEIDDLREALVQAAKHTGPQLTLAAAAVAAGFLSFLPTDYRGVSELGKIAGAGMIIAYITSVTVLPALLKLFNPLGEPEPIGFSALAPVDRFLDRYRIPVLAGTAIVVLLGLPLLFHMRFDFNPINLRSPKVESIATYLDLQKDPKSAGIPVEVLANSQEQARTAAEQLGRIPQVSRVMTLDTFIPPDQDEKLPIIRDLSKTLEPELSGPEDPPPSDAENVSALQQASEALAGAASGKEGPGAAAAKRLAADLNRLSGADAAARRRAETALVLPLKIELENLRQGLEAERVTRENLPADLVSDWVSPDGRVRVEAYPKADPNDSEATRQFARAVLEVEPNAVGGPISILESGDTIIKAFIQAGIWAILSIAVLLWIVLRRIGDVLLTLVPLLLAGVVTMEAMVLIGLPLNFANIIALPLLLGLGVAFKIYYIMAWRSGQTNLLQTSLTRAVIFSAMTTATAFGSLWLSHHPGTSSMGELLALSLVCTLAAAVLFQPALMGRPRGLGDT